VMCVRRGFIWTVPMATRETKAATVPNLHGLFSAYPKGAKPDDRGDPWNNHYFSFELDNEEVAHFQECTGFKTESEVYIVEEGGFNGHVHKRPGRAKWSTVTLKFMTTASATLMEWRDNYIGEGKYNPGESPRKARKSTTAAVVVRANDGTELRRYTMSGVWPFSWTGPALSSGGSDLAVETLEIAFDQLYLGDGGPTPAPPEPPPPEEFVPEGEVLFDFNKSTLKPEGKAAVDSVSKQLDKNPDVKTMWVEGHTCDIGTAARNQQLSTERAKVCADRLKKSHPDRTFIDTGYSFRYPKVPNKGAAGMRAPNRRTQFFTSDRGGAMRPGEIAYVKYDK